jgi:IS1 family transposase
MVAWVLGKRDQKTFKRLYDQLKHLKDCIFYTDNWDVFAKVLPKSRHIVGKAHTHIVESNNTNTRHFLGRFTRKTKIVSKCEDAVNYALKLSHAMTVPVIFRQFQHTSLSTYYYSLPYFVLLRA